MRICVAQLEAIPGDVERNLANHVEWIDLAVSLRADLIFFPELSLTGYEPRLAGRLATTPDDSRLGILQRLSDAHGILIGAGLPLVATKGVEIGMVFFRPHESRLRYSKRLLHADELPFFVGGERPLVFASHGFRFAPAICFESLQPEHAEESASAGATVYLASVAKSARGVARAYEHYPAVARRHGMTVLMANSVGPCDDFVSVGQSAVWNDRGELWAELDDEREGIFLFDTEKREAQVSA